MAFVIGYNLSQGHKLAQRPAEVTINIMTSKLTVNNLRVRVRVRVRVGGACVWYACGMRVVCVWYVWGPKCYRVGVGIKIVQALCQSRLGRVNISRCSSELDFSKLKCLTHSSMHCIHTVANNMHQFPVLLSFHIVYFV